ncbi:MAG TPA: quinone oxidoreductase [Azospirillaceae bacterium]|nr:quinone oxidoreductase [Azospirillaceae bacterium]
MPLQIQLPRLGGPEVLTAVETPRARLRPGEVRMRQTVVGFNYLDVYLRRGVYAVDLPAVLGNEAAGVVTEVGPEVEGIGVGDRVAYAGPMGAYADERAIPADALVRIPDGVSDEAAAALLFKGLTAHMLLRRVYPVQAGDAVVVHAAAGGVGMLLTSWARHLGATVIATVGSEAKAARARAAGAGHVAVQGRDSLPGLVRDVTGGVGAAAVFDSVGRDTFEHSLGSLRPFGVFASYGQASGEVPAIEAGRLSAAGSVFFVRPSVFRHIADPAIYRQAAAELFDLTARGVLVPEIGLRLPLTEAAEAHRLAEARRTTGATLLVP